MTQEQIQQLKKHEARFETFDFDSKITVTMLEGNIERIHCPEYKVILEKALAEVLVAKRTIEETLSKELEAI